MAFCMYDTYKVDSQMFLILFCRYVDKRTVIVDLLLHLQFFRERTLSNPRLII